MAIEPMSLFVLANLLPPVERGRHIIPIEGMHLSSIRCGIESTSVCLYLVIPCRKQRWLAFSLHTCVRLEETHPTHDVIGSYADNQATSRVVHYCKSIYSGHQLSARLLHPVTEG